MDVISKTVEIHRTPSFAIEVDGVPHFDVHTFRDVTDSFRDCESFTEWKQGWTPKEHLEMDILEREKARIERKEQRDLERERIEDARAVREEERHEIEVKSSKTAIRNYYIELGIIVMLAASAAWVQFTTVKMQIDVQRTIGPVNK